MRYFHADIKQEGDSRLNAAYPRWGRDTYYGLFRKKAAVIVFAVVMLLTSVSAAGTGKVFWGTIENGKAIVYIQDPGEVSSITAQVGTTVCSSVTQAPISTLEHPVETVVMVDNSLSIPASSRQLIDSFLNDLIGARMAGERFTITCVSDKVSYLCQDETDYTKLKKAVSGITYNNQETYTTDVLYEMLKALKAKNDGCSSELSLSRTALTTRK